MPFTESLYRPEYCDIAAKVLANGESLAAVCAELDICRKTLYNWKDAHPEFESALDRGLQKSQRDWERLGKQGISGEIDRFSPTPWIFTMKNRFRADYAEEKEKSSEGVLIEKLLDKLVDK